MGAVLESNATYLTIYNGKLCKRVPQPTKTSQTRVNKQGKTVHEEFYKGWKGRITAIEVREHKEYGKFWNVTLTDEDGDVIIQMNYSSSFSQAFLKTLPNIDLKGDIVFTPSVKMEGDKKKSTVFINQHGKSVKWYYTKEDNKGLPKLKKIKVKGKESWDDSDILEFLEDMVKTDIVPKLPKGAVPVAGKKPEVIEVEAEETEEVNPDDLPF